MSVRRPAKVYTWAPAWPSGRVLGWLLIALGGFAALDALFELVRAFSATSITTSGFGGRCPGSVMTSLWILVGSSCSRFLYSIFS